MSSTEQSSYITLKEFLNRFNDTKKPAGGISGNINLQIEATSLPFTSNTVYKHLKKWNDILKPFATEEYTLFNMESTLKSNVKQKNTPNPISKDVADTIIPSRLYLYFGYLVPKDSKKTTLQELLIPAIDFPFLFGFFNTFSGTVKDLPKTKKEVLILTQNILRKSPDEFIPPDSQAFTDTVIKMCQEYNPKTAPNERTQNGSFLHNYKNREAFIRNILGTLSRCQHNNEDVREFLEKLCENSPEKTIQDFLDSIITHPQYSPYSDIIIIILELFVNTFINEYIAFYQDLLDLILPNELFALIEEFNEKDDSEIPNYIKNTQPSYILNKLFPLLFYSVEVQKNFYKELNSLLDKNKKVSKDYSSLAKNEEIRNRYSLIDENRKVRYLFKDADHLEFLNLIERYTSKAY